MSLPQGFAWHAQAAGAGMSAEDHACASLRHATPSLRPCPPRVPTTQMPRDVFALTGKGPSGTLAPRPLEEAPQWSTGGCPFLVILNPDSSG